jgi:hypothetical protein
MEREALKPGDVAGLMARYDGVIAAGRRNRVIAESLLPGGWRVLTSESVYRFAPAWGMPGEPHHYETLVTNTHGDFGNSEETYATESDALQGHQAITARLRAGVAAS